MQVPETGGQAQGGPLLDIGGVAEFVRLSPKTVARLAKARKMPPPLVVGGSRRWRRSDIEAWIAAGCPALVTTV